MKLIFFDIDGTLLQQGHDEIDPTVIAAINSIRDEQTHAFIATGRNFTQAEKYIKQLGAKSYITSNGQEICFNGEIVYQDYMKLEQCREIITYLDSKDVHWGYETRSRIYLGHGESAEEIRTLIEGYGMVDVEISEDHLVDGVFQMWTFGTKEQMDLVFPHLADKYTALRWGDTSIEIVGTGQNKGHGIEVLKKLIDTEVTTYAFGDGANDLEMMQTVDYSVAMGNAIDELKAVSKYQTTNIDDNGIINGMKEVGLLCK